jgi:hypothetical protein
VLRVAFMSLCTGDAFAFVAGASVYERRACCRQPLKVFSENLIVEVDGGIAPSALGGGDRSALVVGGQGGAV